jgi:biopolymer transport protein TolQ
MQPHSLNLVDMILESSFMAKVVLLTLIGSSVFCWAIILSKLKTLSTCIHQNQAFSELFWTNKSMEETFAKSAGFPKSSVAAIFKNGYTELKRVRATDAELTLSEKVDNIQRSLHRSTASEVANLESQLSWLGTTASAAPFVGLFGTVWGILESFRSIGSSGAANLAVVGPSISEALITTAVGIAVAIPAVVAYNHFAGRIRKIAVDMECFSQDFIIMVQRNNAYSGKKD